MSVCVPKGLRNAIRRGEVKCWYCGDLAQTGDHVVPKALGGKNGWANVVPACKQCNEDKNHMTLEEYRAVRKARFLQTYVHIFPQGSLPSIAAGLSFYGEVYPVGCAILDRSTKETHDETHAI